MLQYTLGAVAGWEWDALMPHLLFDFILPQEVDEDSIRTQMMRRKIDLECNPSVIANDTQPH